MAGRVSGAPDDEFVEAFRISSNSCHAFLITGPGLGKGVAEVARMVSDRSGRKGDDSDSEDLPEATEGGKAWLGSWNSRSLYERPVGPGIE
jgi:hypothetical protein